MTDAGLVETEARAGDIVSIPGDVPHGYSNASTEATVFSAIIDKDMAAYFEVADIGVSDSQPAADAEHFTAAANAHGIRILAA
jgi:hypothetical protein